MSANPMCEPRRKRPVSSPAQGSPAGARNGIIAQLLEPQSHDSTIGRQAHTAAHDIRMAMRAVILLLHPRPLRHSH